MSKCTEFTANINASPTFSLSEYLSFPHFYWTSSDLELGIILFSQDHFILEYFSASKYFNTEELEKKKKNNNLLNSH